MTQNIYPRIGDELRPITIAKLKRYADQNSLRQILNQPSNPQNFSITNRNFEDDYEVTFSSGVAVVAGLVISNGSETTISIPASDVDTSKQIKINVPVDENGLPTEALTDSVDSYIEYTSRDGDNYLTLAEYNETIDDFVQTGLTSEPVENIALPEHNHRLERYLKITKQSDSKTLDCRKVSFTIDAESTRTLRLPAEPAEYSQTKLKPYDEIIYRVVAEPVRETPTGDINHLSYIDGEEAVLKVTNLNPESISVEFNIMLVQIRKT